MAGDCLRAVYTWGEARFWMSEKGYVLYAVTTSSSSMTGPRGTKVGMSETDVTEQFRDMGQPHDQNGDRSLYYNEKEGKRGKLYFVDEKHSRIDYVYTRADQAIVTLRYELENGRVVKMTIRCDNR